MEGGSREDQLRACLVASSSTWANSGTNHTDIWFYTPTPSVTGGFRISAMWMTKVPTFPHCFNLVSIKTVATALIIISSHNYVQDRKKIKISSPSFLSGSIFPRNSLGDLFLSPDWQEWVTYPSVNQLAASGNGVAHRYGPIGVHSLD